MKIIVGLGNPGAKYRETRHNVGFKAVDELALRYRVEKEECKYNGLVGHLRIENEKVLLVKPLTYMNLSGKAVAPLVHFYKLDLKDVLVIYDDMDLPLGALRLRAKGGTGGHKGVLSVAEMLKSQDFPRIRIGIGRPPADTIDWVLGEFTPEEKPVIEAAVKKAADAAVCWVLEGIEKAMNKYNG
ncbi:peptidyl-tRNA hydrolase, PTH1 family [Thermosyntropha lipolytica DSM 11003]|uniref:Peptidyl-tRNA hydrolase n=1 Tax=Thermosyntropha lipolytica DSM 11003 TaxID=1123382 RepID=A0A1M5JRG2_9FIRM|nr:aminoacyl-tRNA hydrolase [Thermosyntropha lipolytica]SHG43108.1 peptidyl-tRNA hydrolase, PTH1 family [Thermosyntropha lipolytica DSM 11003]